MDSSPRCPPFALVDEGTGGAVGLGQLDLVELVVDSAPAVADVYAMVLDQSSTQFDAMFDATKDERIFKCVNIL